MKDIITIEEIEANKTKEVNWDKHNEWLDRLLETAQHFRDNNPV